MSRFFKLKAELGKKYELSILSIMKIYKIKVICYSIFNLKERRPDEESVFLLNTSGGNIGRRAG